jgi:Protein of unknown function (DUF2752)
MSLVVLTPPRIWILVGLAGLAAAVGLSWLPQQVGAGLPLCLFRELLGLPCPGCGMTRALHALAHGEVAAALRYHPLAPLVVAQSLALWMFWGLHVRDRRLAASVPRGRWFSLLYANGAIFLALWVGRLAAGTLPW